MKRMKIILVFSLIGSLTACSGSTTKSGKQLKEKEETIAGVQNEYLNKNLEKDAKSGKTYSENYYCVLTSEKTLLYDMDANPMSKTVKRGTVFSKITNAKSHEGYFAALIDDETVYLSNKATYFEQEVKGMRYPLFGIVESDKENVKWYDEIQQKNREFLLKKGTIYLYVITKDNSYINVWIPEEKEYVTTEYCCKVKIIQAKDHAKLLRDYKTKMSGILQ